MNDMTLRYNITKEHMKRYVENNEHLISVKKQAPGITVLKYKNKVFYKALWTDELCELRGTVVDDNFDIIQRPFTKIFNSGEKRAPHIDDSSRVTAPEKVNGFMGAATWHNGGLFVSTTGSIASDFCDMAREHIEKLTWDWEAHKDISYTFEICDPRDPHVVPEEHGAWLLNARKKTWEARQHAYTEAKLDNIACSMRARRPKWHEFDTFRELKEVVRTVNHEGFVIWDDFGHELKIKSPYYLATKFLGRKTEKRLNELLDDTRSAKEILDEEYYVVLDHLAEHKDLFISLTEQDRFAYLRDFFDKEVLK